MNVARLLERSARERPGHLAVVHGATERSYADVAGRVARLAGALRARGLEPGDRVAIVQWNGPELLETLLAAFHAGLVAVPLNARSTPHEAQQVLEDAEPRAVVYGPEYAEHAVTFEPALRVCLDAHDTASLTYADALGAAAIPVADVAPDDVAWLFYTSGTTGRPKGAMLTHRNLLAMVTAYLADLRWTLPSHVVVHAAPLTHGSGLYALPALARGATQAITTSRSFEPEELLQTIASLRATDVAFLTPTMVRWMVEAQERAPSDLSTLEHIVYGGGPMYRDDLVHALGVIGPHLSQIYGQAEAPVTIARMDRAEHALALSERPELLTSAGRPYTTVEVGVETGDGVAPDGEGEIVARGDVVMRGYWRNEEATAETVRGGWLHTGDLGAIGPDGYLHLLDRSKDMIISGGANIYPREVEELLLEHPAVRQVAVVGAPDDEWGERVVAVLALHAGHASNAVEPELDALCRERLAGYKRPRRYDWREELPTSSYGKVLKRELRDGYWQARERRI